MEIDQNTTWWLSKWLSKSLIGQFCRTRCGRSRQQHMDMVLRHGLRDDHHIPCLAYLSDQVRRSLCDSPPAESLQRAFSDPDGHSRPGGRISVEIVDEEKDRLKYSWTDPHRAGADDELRVLIGGDRFAEMDAFDRLQIAHVLDVCRKCRSLSEAGRQLFSASRGRKASTNDADRLRKYLNRFGIEWSQIS
jgi:hypothetical protein